jgi:lipoprotein-anchoring transpeptidase ErfK/SrfK
MRLVYLSVVLILLLAGLVSPSPALAGAPREVATLTGLPFANPTAMVNSVAPRPSYAALALTTHKGKWIDVNLTKQKLTAYSGSKVINSSLMSSGVAGKRTPTGTFTIRDHIRSKLMTGPGYYLPNVPYVMHFYGSDAIHGTYWHHNFGHPMSHGCLNLPTSFAAWLYYWTPNGTKVYIHY